MVIGSGLLLKAFYKVFLYTHFMVVRVGKAITSEIRESYSERATFFDAPEHFYEDAEIVPPYPSVINYDAKLWRFVVKNGEEDDFVWKRSSKLLQKRFQKKL